MADDLRIVAIRQATKQLPSGAIGNVIETVFNVGNDGPFTIDTPVESYTPEFAKSQIDEFADQIRGTRDLIK